LTFSDDKLIWIFISSGCLQILVNFLTLDYQSDKDLIGLAIDKILELLDKSVNPTMSFDDICRLLIRNNLLSVLADLIPSLLGHADN